MFGGIGDILRNEGGEAKSDGVNKQGDSVRRGMNLAPRVGFEPTTLRLTAECSTVELPRIRVGQLAVF